MAKIEWKTPFDRFRDQRLLGGFSKQPDGTWLVQIGINPRNGNSRFPDPGEEVIVPVKGEDHSFRVLERIHPPMLPADPAGRDELYSWWTFEPVADSNSGESERLTSMSYKLDKTLNDVLREQMIAGGVPESEVAPSIEDIEEAMDKRLKKSNLTDEDYASLSPEVNQSIVKIIREMRAAGASEEQIMAEVTDIVNHAAEANSLRSSMPDDHIISAMTPAQLNAHLANDPLQSTYYTLRLSGDQLNNVKSALKVFLNMIGESNPEAPKIFDALTALDTAEYDVGGSQSGLENIPTMPE